MKIAESELILNKDGSVYHLTLLPEDIADTIITVGDPERVPMVTKYFDKIEIQKSNREFVTHTGYLGNKKVSVIATGIGTDNIDIVLNELDALVNIDLKARTPKKQLKSLNIIRIGTSGALQNDIPIDSFLVSEYAVGLEGLLHFYQYQNAHNKINNAVSKITNTESYTTQA
ncbi:MAG: phosphorylase, partial [Bacteroidetes bacterium]|nr:phosphorylase [Bacteroidota bacterium]